MDFKRYAKRDFFKPGLAWIDNGQHLIVDVREITKGTARGKLIVVRPKYDMTGQGRWKRGKGAIVDPRSIIKYPEANEA